MIKIISIIYICLMSVVFAGDFHEWDKQLLDVDIQMNPLELRNRAACAKDSSLPTRSAFLLIDNTLMGKAAYRLAKLTGRDHNEFTTEAIKVYRKKMIYFFDVIAKKMINRELPILPTKLSKLHLPTSYAQIISSCYGQDKCDELTQYLSKVWANSEKTESSVSKILNNYKLDNFHSEENYFNQKYVKGTTRVSCNRLKKFSPLQSHLYGTKPDREDLQRIAESLSGTNEFIGSCDDVENDSLKVIGLQFDFMNIDDSYWNEIGFDFWNSMKMYLAFAFKNVVLPNSSFDYELIIQSSSIEDSILLVSNGCKSTEAPACNSDYLSKSVLSEMGKDDYKKNALDLDILSPIVTGAQDDMLDNPFTAVNSDILDLATRKDANEWIESLFSNFSGTKSYIKNKLISALSFYSIISKKLTVYKLTSDLNRYYHLSDLSDNRVKNDIYYLCSEVKFVSDETFSFVRKNINIIKETGFVDSKNLIFNDQTLKELFNDYEYLLLETNKFCDSLDSEHIWNDDFEFKKSGFSQWYLDKTLLKTKMKSTSDDDLNNLNEEKYLSYKAGNSTICHSPSSCIRKSIAHILEITRATQYASTFWAAEEMAKSKDIFNPYAERVACKVYDPWFKTKATLTNFVSDISQAVVSRFTAGVLYSKFSLQPGQVTSFNSMVSEGKILFNKNYKKESVMMELVTDFGPLLGVPCSLSISGQKNNAYSSLYQFSGVSVGACTSKEVSTMTVYSAADLDNIKADQGSGCFACQLNFESVSNTLSYFNYALGPVYYLVRSVVRLYQGFKDPDNIPHNWNLNLRHLKNTYSRFGYIPKKCAKKIADGKACLGSREEEIAVDYLQDTYDLKITAERDIRNGVAFKVDGCRSDVEVKFLSNDRMKLSTNCKLVKK